MKKRMSGRAVLLLTVLLLSGCGTKPSSEPLTTPAVQTPSPEIRQRPEAVIPTPAEQEIPSGEPVRLSEEMRYEINIFLSNFAEQNFKEHEAFETERDELICFLHTFLKANVSGCIEYKQLGGGMTYETIPLETLNRYADRFFGKTWTEEDLRDYIVTGVDGDVIYRMYYLGDVYYTAADGEALNRLAVADEVSSRDGKQIVRFSTYVMDPEAYFDSGITAEHYSLAPQDAAQRKELSSSGSGWAILIPYDRDGRNTYRLEQYHWEPSNGS